MNAWFVRLLSAVIFGLVIVALTSCRAPPGRGPEWVPRPPPPELRTCQPPMKPPPVPPVPRTIESVAVYAWGEARARWMTAARLRECAALLAEAHDWIEENR